jgi:hypothetical protein
MMTEKLFRGKSGKMENMEKVYYGIFYYEDELAVLLANAKSWDKDRIEMCHPLSKEVYATMAEAGLEYIEETLWGYFDGTEEELDRLMKEAGFIFKQEVKEEGESILGEG